MKIVIVFAAVFILFSLAMGNARKRGRLNEEANKAVGALANAMRYFVYGLLAFVGLACAALIYHM